MFDARRQRRFRMDGATYDILAALGEPLSVRELAAAVRMDSVALGQTVARLLASGAGHHRGHVDGPARG